jgi:hypothetical protein
MTDQIMFVAAFAVIAVVLMATKFNWKRYEVRRGLKTVPEAFIGDTIDGEYVRVRGNVYAVGETLRAPLSGRQCVYYHVTVDEERRGKRNSTFQIIEEELMADVILTDGTDYVVVETDEPKTYLVVDREYEQGLWKDADREMKAFLEKHGHSIDTFWGFNRRLKYYEAILAPDEELTIAGFAEWRDASAFDFRIPAERVLVIRPGPHGDVYISDDRKLLRSPKV